MSLAKVLFKLYINSYIKKKNEATFNKNPVILFPWASCPDPLGPALEMHQCSIRFQVLSEKQLKNFFQGHHPNKEIQISGELTGTHEN